VRDAIRHLEVSWVSHLDVKPISLNDANITHARNNARIIEGNKSIGASSEMSPAQLLQEKPLRGLNRPHPLSIDIGGYPPIGNFTEGVRNWNSGGNSAEALHPFDNPTYHLSGDAAPRGVVYQNTLVPRIPPL
jgi:hypothetical protein